MMDFALESRLLFGQWSNLTEFWVCYATSKSSTRRAF
jgi:hypothetical protein